MSGGHFDYKQHHIREIADEVEQLILTNGKKLSEEFDYTRDYSDEVIAKFKDGLLILRAAYIYAQRIDWLVSGDDGEDSFIKRLNDELTKL